MKLPAISGNALVGALKKGGWQIARREGSHVTLRHLERPTPITVTLNWTYGRRVLKPFLKSIGLTEREFRRLL